MSQPPDDTGLPPEEYTGPIKPLGYARQWQGILEVTKPDGSKSTQNIRVDRTDEDTDEMVRIKLQIAAAEIQAIIAERGGDYEIAFDIVSIEEI